MTAVQERHREVQSIMRDFRGNSDLRRRIRHCCRMACVTVFYGEDVSDAEAEETQKLLAELLGEDVDLTLVPGGQPVYAYLIAVE